MTLVLCLDDNLGMMFNHRRQSRDRVLIADLLETVGDRRLFVSPYSKALFPEGAANITVAEDPGAAAGEDDFAFVDGYVALPKKPGLGVEVNKELVVEENRNPHNWKNPVWHHEDGSVAEW